MTVATTTTKSTTATTTTTASSTAAVSTSLSSPSQANVTKNIAALPHYQQDDGIPPSLSSASSCDDMAYCHEVARRSVARAALHLGVECMSGDALDAMGDALVAFLERLGKSISTMVEASNRTSAHVNVLDALHAVEACTAPAAYQMMMSTDARIDGTNQLTTTATASSGTESGGIEGNTNGKRISNMGGSGIGGTMFAPSLAPVGTGGGMFSRQENFMRWESLASFLFGPNWLTLSMPGEERRAMGAVAGTTSDAPMMNGPISGPSSSSVFSSTLMNGPGNGHGGRVEGGAGGGGKGGKDLAMARRTALTPNDGNTDPNSAAQQQQQQQEQQAQQQQQRRQQGWNAPYLDDIPPFPLYQRPGGSRRNRRTHIANPHRLPAHLSLALHSLATEEEACRGNVAVGSGHRHDDQEYHRDDDGGDDGGDGLQGGSKDGTAKGVSASTDAARRAEGRAAMEASRIPEEAFLKSSPVNEYCFWGTLGMEEAGGGGQTVAERRMSDKMDLDGEDKKDDDDDGGKKSGVKRTRFELDEANDKKDKGDNEGESAQKKQKMSTEDAEGSSNKILETIATANEKDGFSSSMSALGGDKNDADALARRRRPGYVPSFLPPFPPERTYGGGILGSGAGGGGGSRASLPTSSTIMRGGGSIGGGDSKGRRKQLPALSTLTRHSFANQGATPLAGVPLDGYQGGDDVVDGTGAGASLVVRQSLVRMGRTIGGGYWGSGWRNSDAGALDGSLDFGGQREEDRLTSIYVRSGRSASSVGEGGSSAGAVSVSLSGGTASTNATVVPLGRASGSRVSRILEGSMDAVH